MLIKNAAKVFASPSPAKFQTNSKYYSGRIAPVLVPFLLFFEFVAELCSVGRASSCAGSAFRSYAKLMQIVLRVALPPG